MTRLLITGANRGIGLELVRARLSLGDDVIACAREPQQAGVLRNLLAEFPQQLRVLQLNVTDAISVFNLCNVLGDAPVDVLVNNAGVIGPDRQSTLDMDYDGWSETFAINTMGPLRVTQALLPNLRRAEKGRVLIISSQMGSFASTASDRLAYRTSKAAVNKVAQALATDFLPMRIAVAAVHPGWVRTQMGGASAPLAAPESAQGVSSLIDQLDCSRTGLFLNVDGAELRW
jgi:NAD(P)-dependent dehydrogenase (short-subunit alcohol dehydrogenase family)